MSTFLQHQMNVLCTLTQILSEYQHNSTVLVFFEPISWYTVSAQCSHNLNKYYGNV
jgi:hypothetical protein